MHSIRPCSLPPQALLAKYAGAGGYTDCYTTEIAKTVPHAAYVEAFYTSWLFRLERRLIGLFLSRPTTDAEVTQLAAGSLGHFAAWRVEDRAADQLLMCDVSGRTRSWLMVSASQEPAQGTRLYFGSAVVPVASRSTGKSSMGVMFKALLGFHKVYSRALLGSARVRLARTSH